MYLDLTLGGLMCTENDYLLDDPANWGPRGFLTKSDQFVIVLGNVVFISTNLFPFILMTIMEIRFRMRYQNRSMMAQFDQFYSVLYENLRTDVSGPLHYWSIFLVRKLVFAYIVYYLDEEIYTVLQVFLNAYLSLIFALFLAAGQPFTTPYENKV